MSLGKSRAHKATGWLRLVVYNILIFSLICLVIEGAASYVLLVRDKMTLLPLAERRHTKYDP